MVELLAAADGARLFRIGRVRVWRRVNSGHLPRPVCPAPKMARWRAEEIDEIIERASKQRQAAALPGA